MHIPSAIIQKGGNHIKHINLKDSPATITTCYRCFQLKAIQGNNKAHQCVTATAEVQSCGRLHLQNANLTRLSVHTAGMQMSLLNGCLANKTHVSEKQDFKCCIHVALSVVSVDIP